MTLRRILAWLRSQPKPKRNDKRGQSSLLTQLRSAGTFAACRAQLALELEDVICQVMTRGDRGAASFRDDAERNRRPKDPLSSASESMVTEQARRQAGAAVAVALMVGPGISAWQAVIAR